MIVSSGKDHRKHPGREHGKAERTVVGKYTGHLGSGPLGVLELMPLWSASLSLSEILCSHIRPSLFLYSVGWREQSFRIKEARLHGLEQVLSERLRVLLRSVGTMWCASHGCVVADLRQVMPSPVPGTQRVHN